MNANWERLHDRFLVHTSLINNYVPNKQLMLQYKQLLFHISLCTIGRSESYIQTVSLFDNSTRQCYIKTANEFHVIHTSEKEALNRTNSFVNERHFIAATIYSLWCTISIRCAPFKHSYIVDNENIHHSRQRNQVIKESIFLILHNGWNCPVMFGWTFHSGRHFSRSIKHAFSCIIILRIFLFSTALIYHKAGQVSCTTSNLRSEIATHATQQHVLFQDDCGPLKILQNHTFLMDGFWPYADKSCDLPMSPLSG